MYFFIESKNDIRFLEKSIIKILFKLKVNFSLCNTEESKTLIIRIYIICKKAHIHDSSRNFQEKGNRKGYVKVSLKGNNIKQFCYFSNESRIMYMRLFTCYR